MKQSRRALVISGIMVIITAGTLLRLPIVEHIRAVELLAILACGASVGVFAVHLFHMFGKKTHT